MSRKRRFSAPFSALVDNEVFAVDERSAQLIVRSPSEEVAVDIDGVTTRAPTNVDVAVVSVSGLAPNTRYRAVISDADGRNVGELDVQTLPSLGPIRSRFATVSDVHLGAESFAHGSRITNDQPVSYPLRCGRSAVTEATSWGAEVLLVKGDLTDTGAIHEWKLAEKMFADVTIPLMFSPGNHDVHKKREIEPCAGTAAIGASGETVQHHDLDGIRLVLVDTSKPNRGSGTLTRSVDSLRDVIDTDQPVFLGLHHNIQRTPVTWFWPPGIPSTNALPVVRSLVEVNERLFISSGHTHRNRCHWLSPNRNVPFTEVSATSDYPGVWASYEVGERGIRQTVRRIEHADAVSWTERTRSAFFGVWPRWSQGRTEDRCVDLLFR